MSWSAPDAYVVGQILTATSMNKISGDLTWLHTNGDFICRGTVTAAGTVGIGTGFSAARGSTGNFTVTFTVAFSAAPIVVVSIADNSNQNGQISSPSASTTGFNVSTFDATGTLANRAFAFVAVEQ